MRPPPRAAPAAAGLVLALSAAPPAFALCPNCLAQQSTLTPTLKLIGLFLLIPFALAASVFWIVRRLSHRPVSPPPSGPSPAPASSAGGVQGG